MPRVHQKKAAKDYPQQGIKKGDTYYSWTFKNRAGPGTLVRSSVAPKPSQLTRSEYMSRAYELQERIGALEANDLMRDEVEDVVSNLRELADEQQEKLDNMPDGLQQGGTGQLLESRVSNTNEYADELEGIDLADWEQDDEESKEDCSVCRGDKVVNGTECANCGGTGKVLKDDPVNIDGETEQEYWNERLDEVNGCTFNIE